MKQRKREPILAAVLVVVFITVCVLYFTATEAIRDVLPPDWPLILHFVIWLFIGIWGASLLGGLLITAASAVHRCWRHMVVDHRIIRQAQAAGVWDKTPTVLGGRALDLKAWEAYKIERRFGETDTSLRIRCWAADVLAQQKAKEPTEQAQGGEGV